MENNIFYVYILVKDATQAKLPPAVRQTLSSDCGENMILLLSVCKERELEECLTEKVKFWKESMVNVKTNFNGVELIIHQIRTSDGGLKLSHTIIRSIAEAKLTLKVTYTDCKLI